MNLSEIGTRLIQRKTVNLSRDNTLCLAMHSGKRINPVIISNYGFDCVSKQIYEKPLNATWHGIYAVNLAKNEAVGYASAYRITRKPYAISHFSMGLYNDFYYFPPKLLRSLNWLPERFSRIIRREGFPFLPVGPGPSILVYDKYAGNGIGRLLQSAMFSVMRLLGARYFISDPVPGTEGFSKKLGARIVRENQYNEQDGVFPDGSSEYEAIVSYFYKQTEPWVSGDRDMTIAITDISKIDLNGAVGTFYKC